MTKRFTVKTIFAFIVLYRCTYNFNFATEPTINIRPQEKGTTLIMYAKDKANNKSASLKLKVK
ncbi:hypothetical protein MKS65_07245 [Staphylococcus haemolyticus]|uniref:hypothetical protein n=1 Tax=Staphylococcus haemolyticus TaxID=1283 RepID=UPI001F0ABD69|nr:hypothetical protein [Staphylococcus haemolyticus]MCH4378208.1 hypothetical protein [Staphylococcus haemolyticus]